MPFECRAGFGHGTGVNSRRGVLVLDFTVDGDAAQALVPVPTRAMLAERA
jgi:hypothetical protein